LNFLFILKVANIRCFILIAVEIFHSIIRKQPRTKEIRRCLIFFHPGKNPMLTRPIFIRPADSEFIRESVCACAKSFVDEENVGCAKIESWKNKNIDGFYMKTTQQGGFSKLCAKIKKRYYTFLFHFSTCKHNLVSFFRPNRILTVELHRSFIYIFFSGENAR
jgi:hypothetical protein